MNKKAIDQNEVPFPSRTRLESSIVEQNILISRKQSFDIIGLVVLNIPSKQDGRVHHMPAGRARKSNVH